MSEQTEDFSRMTWTGIQQWADERNQRIAEFIVDDCQGLNEFEVIHAVADTFELEADDVYECFEYGTGYASLVELEGTTWSLA